MHSSNSHDNASDSGSSAPSAASTTSTEPIEESNISGKDDRRKAAVNKESGGGGGGGNDESPELQAMRRKLEEATRSEGASEMAKPPKLGDLPQRNTCIQRVPDEERLSLHSVS